MEFQNGIKLLAEKIQSFKENTKTEEATKTAFVIPFLRLLGYDDTNPTEVVPEYNADFGNRNLDKVDYAVFYNSQPIMIIECKHWGVNLNAHDYQLFKYFNASKSRFGILTNGIRYKFFTDLVEPNKMDEEPFLEFDFENIKEQAINELRKFHKSAFDVTNILDSANELKYSAKIRSIIEKELSDPSEEFVKFIGNQIYEGRLVKKLIDQFTPMVKKTANQTIKEMVNERLQTALKKEEQVKPEEELVTENSSPTITITEEELEGFLIVKSILRTKCESTKIQYNDNQNYFTIYYERPRQIICRLYFNREKKYIGLVKDRKEERKQIVILDDIFTHSDKLIEILSSYLKATNLKTS